MSITLVAGHNLNDHLQWFACMCGAVVVNREELGLDLGGIEVHGGFRAGSGDCGGPCCDREAVGGEEGHHGDKLNWTRRTFLFTGE